MENGVLAQHFGHSKEFALVDVDPRTKQVSGKTEVAAPEHQPGLLPPWLKRQGVSHVIAGGMGSRAQGLFKEVSIEVVTGAPPESADFLVKEYLEGRLVSRPHVCDH
jgi:predicted Fe-Mo cluster-binding NifX family protein